MSRRYDIREHEQGDYYTIWTSDGCWVSCAVLARTPNYVPLWEHFAIEGTGSNLSPYPFRSLHDAKKVAENLWWRERGLESASESKVVWTIGGDE